MANKKTNVQWEQTVGPSCKRPAYIEIGESSESVDQTARKESHG
jgi:hypothetical protein